MLHIHQNYACGNLDHCVNNYFLKLEFSFSFDVAKMNLLEQFAYFSAAEFCLGGFLCSKSPLFVFSYLRLWNLKMSLEFSRDGSL